MAPAGPASAIEVRGQRFVINDDPAMSTPYPRLMGLPDGRLVVGLPIGVSPDYFVHGELAVLVSEDEGASWKPTDDPAVPLNWPGSSTRERHDRATRVLPDGSYFATGAIGWQAWPAERRDEAVARGRFVTPAHPPGRPDLIGVGVNTVYVQRSTDGGGTWSRREIELPAAGWTLGLPRNITLHDGTLVLPLRQRSKDASRGQFLMLRVTPVPDGREIVRIHAVPRDLDGVTGSEGAVVEVGPDRLVTLMRADATRGGQGHLLSSWSEDGGRTWSLPVATDIWGRPPHLLRLADGRLLCTYGHQRERRGVYAVLSEDGGETWAVAHRALIAADDEGPGGVDAQTGYHPISTQLPDGSFYTAYYVTRAGVSHAYGMRWELPW